MDTVLDTVAIAKRFYGNKASNTKVNAVERDDYMWEMIQFIPDPTLEQPVLDDLKTRGLAVPCRWVTTDIVKPYIIEGIKKSLAKSERVGE